MRRKQGFAEDDKCLRTWKSAGQAPRRSRKRGNNSASVVLPEAVALPGVRRVVRPTTSAQRQLLRQDEAEEEEDSEEDEEDVPEKREGLW